MFFGVFAAVIAALKKRIAVSSPSEWRPFFTWSTDAVQRQWKFSAFPAFRAEGDTPGNAIFKRVEKMPPMKPKHFRERDKNHSNELNGAQHLISANGIPRIAANRKGSTVHGMSFTDNDIVRRPTEPASVYVVLDGIAFTSCCHRK